VVVDADSKKSAEEMYDILLADGTISRLESEQGEDTFTEVFVTEEGAPITSGDYKAMYEALRSDFEQYKKESIKWSVSDFLWLKVEGYTITREQAQKGLEAMINNHDASNGTHWETVRYWYEEYGTKKPSEWRGNDAVEGREYARACSITGEGMNEGWVVSGGEMYIKYEEDAIAFCRDECNQTMEEAYAESEENGGELFYWTNWESDDYQYTYINGILTDKEE
jgi:hypothetical protein